MKKLFSLCLLSFSMLQSCKQEELDVAPKQISSAAAPSIDIQSVVKRMLGFVLKDANAFLLKPVDNDPNTHLTTLYKVKPDRTVAPVIEGFEIKQVEFTAGGIYVLTNYKQDGDPIAFFLRWDDNWVQLKNVGNYVGVLDFGEILFSDNSVFSPLTLKVIKSSNRLISMSENLLLIKNNDLYKVYNKNLGGGHFVRRSDKNKIPTKVISIKEDGMAIVELSLPNVDYKEYITIRINIGDDTNSDITLIDKGTTFNVLYKPKGAVRNERGDGIDVLTEGSYEWVNGAYKLNHGSYLTHLQFDYGVTINGDKWQNHAYSFIKWNGGSLVAPTPLPNKHEVILKKFLKEISTYKAVGDFIYYSGIKYDGQPLTGEYYLNQKVNFYFNNELYSKVIPKEISVGE